MKRRWYWRQKGKGIKNNVIKNAVKYDDYKKTLLEIKQRRHKIKAIQSKTHNLKKYEIKKFLSHALMKPVEHFTKELKL